MVPDPTVASLIWLRWTDTCVEEFAPDASKFWLSFRDGSLCWRWRRNQVPADDLGSDLVGDDRTLMSFGGLRVSVLVFRMDQDALDTSESALRRVEVLFLRKQWT